ncbi:MAG: hypothetical protein HFG56_04640 [Lachnospiraceae bacterium]|nr:hypothetical protein [Lachnospiraceae bacterium]
MRQMKKGLTRLILATMMTLSLCACSSGGGTAPILTVAGKEVILGDTGANVFPLTEFEMTIPGEGLPIGKMPGKSWLSTFMSLKKDGSSYAYLYVYNPGREEEVVTFATIYKLSFTMHTEDSESSHWAEDNVLVNGVNYFGMDANGVKETMTQFKALSEDDDYLSYKDGKYTYRFDLDDNGIVEEVEVEMKIDKSYH